MKSFTFIFLFALLPMCIWAQPGQAELEEDQLKFYSKDAQVKYNMYNQLVVNMLDKNLPPEDRADARILLYELLDAKCKISEPLLGQHAAVSKHKFIEALWKMNLEQPLVRKKATKCEKVVFEETVTAVVQGEVQTWHIYSGKMRACELATQSRKVGKFLSSNENLGLIERSYLKEVKFELRKPKGDADVPRNITISIISTLDKNSAYYTRCKKLDAAPTVPKAEDKDGDGYNKFVDCDDTRDSIHPNAPEIQGNGIDDDCDGSIDEPCEETDADGDGFFASQHCICQKKPINSCDCDDQNPNVKPGAEEILGNGVDDNCNGKIDEELLYSPLTLGDRLIPGLGHLKYGKNYIRYPTSALYFGTFAAATGGAIYFKIKENNSYTRHLAASTFREKDVHYDVANKHHKKFLVLAGAAIVIWSANLLHVSRKNKKQLRILQDARREELIRSKGFTLKIDAPSDPGMVGIGLKANF